MAPASRHSPEFAKKRRRQKKEKDMHRTTSGRAADRALNHPTSRVTRWGLALAAALAALAPPAFAQREVDCGSDLTAADVPEILRLRAAGAWDPPPGLPDDLAAAPIAIPVTVHVVRLNDGTGGLSAARITQAFQDLNTGFAPAFMHFYKCGPTRFIDSTALYDLESWAEKDQLVQTLAVPNTINLYFTSSLVVAGDSYCGLASFSTTSWQGIIVVNGCAGLASNPSTVPHEFGHYFDLYHTHDDAIEPECADGSNGDTGGDLVSDTPADPKLSDENTSGCAYIGTEIDPCGDPYMPDTSNMMCYAGKTCRTNFTPGQVARARATLFNRRPNLIGGGCASTLGSFTGSPRPSGAGGPAPAGKPFLFARRACDASEGPCRTAPDGGTTDDFATATIEVENLTPRALRMYLRIKAQTGALLPGGEDLSDVTRYFRPVAGGRPLENPMTFEPGTTRLELDVKKALGAGLVGRFPANVPFVAQLEAPGGGGLVFDFSIGTLGFRPAAGFYDDGVIEEYVLSRSPAITGDALVVRFDASDLPDPAAGWDVRGAQIVGGEIGGAGLPGLPLIELRLEDPSNPGQPDMSAAGLLRSAGPVVFGAAPSTEYADFADLLLSPPVADPPSLFVLAYMNSGDSLAGTASAIAASSGADGAVLAGNSSILIGGSLPLVPISGRDLMIRLDLNGALSD